MVLLSENSPGNPDLTSENAKAPVDREVAAIPRSRERNRVRARRFQVKAEVCGNARVPGLVLQDAAENARVFEGGAHGNQGFAGGFHGDPSEIES